MFTYLIVQYLECVYNMSDTVIVQYSGCVCLIVQYFSRVCMSNSTVFRVCVYLIVQYLECVCICLIV